MRRLRRDPHFDPSPLPSNGRIMVMLTGSCLCGGVAYEVDAAVGPHRGTERSRRDGIRRSPPAAREADPWDRTTMPLRSLYMRLGTIRDGGVKTSKPQ